MKNPFVKYYYAKFKLLSNMSIDKIHQLEKLPFCYLLTLF